MRLSVVIPLFNEAEHLKTSLDHILGVLDSLSVDIQILLIDDGSRDDTWACIQAFSTRRIEVLGLRLSRNFGKEAALAAGLERADGDAVVVLDGDLQHPPELISEMLKHWNNGAEVVEAVKQHRGSEGWIQRFGARGFYAVFERLTGQRLAGASDFKLMDRKVLDAWRKLNERNLFFRGMHAWLGFRRVEIAFEVPMRAGGRSGWSRLELVRLALNAITAFSAIPLHLISALGLAFLGFATVLGVQTLARKFSGQAVDGFTTVILLLLIIGGALMAGLGIIGAYIARIYEEVKQRPRYLLAETTVRQSS
ncbi:MAG: glycosyltransferase [Bacteroidetes bacterium]|nr:glycosyltransferase [Bacteroidota bacterium]NBY53788.1 glycosyltransferase [Betaproteobacteria bacterium]